MKKSKPSENSYFASSSMTFLKETFDKEPTQLEFENVVLSDMGTVMNLFITTPRDPESKAVWLTFPTHPDTGDRLFYACFPSTAKKGEKCWIVGKTNRGTQEEELEVLKHCNDGKLTNNPFEKLKGIEAKPVTPVDLYYTRCPEVIKHGKDSKLVQVIWDSTQGRPCYKCNRPSDCKLSINGKLRN